MATHPVSLATLLSCGNLQNHIRQDIPVGKEFYGLKEFDLIRQA
jgi:hypothetical protein